MRTLLISAAIAFFLIGLYETYAVGIMGGYFFFMLAVGLLIWVRLRVVQAGQKGK